MKPGSIDVFDTLSWTPKGEKRRGLTKFAIAQNGIKLAGLSITLQASKEAFLCPGCQKIVIDLQEEHN